MNPSKSNMSVFHQIVKLIPGQLIETLAKKHGVSDHCRSFSATSHVLAMCFGQLSHAMSLNDICDALHHHHGVLSQIRGATPPSRNGLSHANTIRDADMVEELFWQVLNSMGNSFPAFVTHGRKYPGVPRRFKRTFNAVDSTTMQLVAKA